MLFCVSSAHFSYSSVSHVSEKALEHSLDHLALTSFGVMDTTLEEVFLKVSEEDHSLENSDAGESVVLARTFLPGQFFYFILFFDKPLGKDNFYNRAEITRYFPICPFADLKGSPSGSSTGKSSVHSAGLRAPQGEGGPSGKEERPEVELSNLVMCSRLSQSQTSLKSSSSVGSVRGDEGGLYADFYGDYCPLFDNGQDSDSASLRGETVARALLIYTSIYMYIYTYISVVTILDFRVRYDILKSIDFRYDFVWGWRSR